MGTATCQNRTDFKHVIWVFVSQLRVAKGQIASYGAFLYQNNCLGESLQRRALAVGGGIYRLQQPLHKHKGSVLLHTLQHSHRWKHRLKSRWVSSTGQTRSEAKTTACVAKTSAAFLLLLCFIVIERWGLDKLQVKDDWPHPFIWCRLMSWKVTNYESTLMINAHICW